MLTTSRRPTKIEQARARREGRGRQGALRPAASAAEPEPETPARRGAPSRPTSEPPRCAARGRASLLRRADPARCRPRRRPGRGVVQGDPRRSRASACSTRSGRSASCRRCAGTPRSRSSSFASKHRELPEGHATTRDLGFDPEAKIREFEEHPRATPSASSAKNDRLGNILRATADEYRDVVRMLRRAARRSSTRYSRKLYGSPKDKFPDGKTSVRDMGFVLYDLLTAIGGERARPAAAARHHRRRWPPPSSTRASTLLRRRADPRRRSTTRSSPTPPPAATT